jgi:hypothetical protein
MLYRALDYTDEYLGFQFYPSELLSLIEATTTAIVAQVILVLSLLRETMIEVGEKRTWVSWWGPGQRLRAEKNKSETLIKKTDEILPTHKSEVPQTQRNRTHRCGGTELSPAGAGRWPLPQTQLTVDS